MNHPTKYFALGTALLLCSLLGSPLLGGSLLGCSGTIETPEQAQPDAIGEDVGLDDIGAEDASMDDAEPGDSADEDTTDQDIADAGDTSAPDGDSTQPPAGGQDLPEGTKFVWPVHGWIVATDFYHSGTEHTTGSADIGAPYWTDVIASRAGTVAAATSSPRGGYYVRLDHGDGYTTMYQHMSAQPVVSKGDRVATGQLLGYSGRTGNAIAGGPHVHFAIRKDGERLVLPQIDFGDWVERGTPIPGDYPELDDLVDAGGHPFEVKVLETSDLHASANWTSESLESVEKDEVLTVIGSRAGYYEAEKNGARGFIPHTATRPLKSEIYATRFTRSGNIRDLPSMDGNVVGSLPKDELATIFEHDGAWRKLLYQTSDGYPAYYWTNQANLEETDEFKARIRSSGVNMRSGPDSALSSLGRLDFFDRIHVLETHQGWYRIQYEGQTGWVAGWHTQGPF